MRDGDGVRPDRDDEARGGQRRAAAPGPAARDPRVRRLRNAERRARRGPAAAGLHRHARHAEHRVRLNPHRLERPHLLGTSERAPLLRPHLHARRSGFHVRRRVDARPVRARLVRPEPDGLGPTRVRRGRQSGGREADGDQRQPSPVQRVHARGPDLRDRRAAARRPNRARRPERRPDDREPRRDHRRRPRRHQPLRRARDGDRDADRSGDRRRLPQRPDPDRRRGDLPVPRHRASSSSSPSRSISSTHRRRL